MFPLANSLTPLGRIKSGIAYLLYDQFTTDRAAGSVNGTSAEPTGGTRTVVDTNGKLSITGGQLSLATGGNGTEGNPGLWYPVQTRVAGKILLGTVIPTINTHSFGWDNDQSSSIADGFNQSTTSILSVRTSDSGGITVGTAVLGNTFNYALVMRGTGMYYFIKGGGFTNWTLAYVSSLGSADAYPGIISRFTNSTFTADNIRIPTSTWLPTPLAYDTASRADGAIGSSDTTGPDGQTTPSLAWTNQVGAYTIVSNKIVGSTLSGGIAIVTLPTSATIDNLHDAALVRSAGDVGVVVRYVDSSNYIKAIHNGTNVQLIKVVAGTPTTLINTASTYVIGAVIRIISTGTKFRVYYNNALKGSEQTISDAALQAGVVGLYTSDTGNSFDNLCTFARGTGNEYSELDKY